MLRSSLKIIWLLKRIRSGRLAWMRRQRWSELNQKITFQMQHRRIAQSKESIHFSIPTRKLFRAITLRMSGMPTMKQKSNRKLSRCTRLIQPESSPGKNGDLETGSNLKQTIFPVQVLQQNWHSRQWLTGVQCFRMNGEQR